MKITEIQNGLSYAGRLRARNYEERSCAPNRRDNVSMRSNEELVKEILTLRHSLRTACRMLAADEYKSSTANKM